MRLKASDRARLLWLWFGRGFPIPILFQQPPKLVIAEIERFGRFALMSFMGRQRSVDQAGFKQTHLFVKGDVEHGRGRYDRGGGSCGFDRGRTGKICGWAPG